MADPDWMPRASLQTLQARAVLRRQTRDFFAERQVLEVEVPLLQRGANLDHGVEPVAVNNRYLITSPEHPLKRLVAAGYGDVWALSTCVRRGEHGQGHEPEFAMLEWYRVGLGLAALGQETIALAALLTGLGGEYEVLTYAEAFQRYAGCDPFTASTGELTSLIDSAPTGATHSELLDLVLVTLVEPELGRSCWCLLTDYPANQAAQAERSTDQQGRAIAKRFELYRNGIELANGYQECTDAGDLRQRLQAEAAARSPAPQLDEHFLAAMAHGLPRCSGVAVGFDRLVALALGLSVAETKAFDWTRA